MSRMVDYCTLYCDRCGMWEPTAHTSITRARKTMSKRGWTHKGKEDFCPVCTPNHNPMKKDK